MLKPVAMLRVSLMCLQGDAQSAVAVLAGQEDFNPEVVSAGEEQLPELPAVAYRQVYQSAAARFGKILPRLTLEPWGAEEPSQTVPLEALQRLDERLGALWRRFSELEEQLHQLQERRHTLQQLRSSLEVFSSLDVDLGLFHRAQGFLRLHLGSIYSPNLGRLEQAAALAGGLVRPFNRKGEATYVVVAGPAESEQEISALLQTADFHPLQIPREFSGYPEKIEQRLALQQQALESEIAEKNRQLAALEQKHREELNAARRTLALAEPYADLAELLRGQRELTLVEGWIPADRLEALSAGLRGGLKHPFVLKSRKPLPAEYPRVPSVLRHSRILRPFVALVKTYGVPRYGEIDPTWLFTITFILMFGMMFGDIGHGAVFVLMGFLLHRRVPGIRPFMAAAGLSSIFFGFCYSSVFSYEGLFPPLWMAPLHDPILMLQMALYWGIGFVYLVSFLTVYNFIAEGSIREALFSPKGGGGILLYSGGLYSSFRWMGSGVFGAAELLAILLPLSAVLIHQWRRLESPLGERLLVVVIEGYESLMNYLANTLSFLRVAAFSLNHVALAVAVFTLAEMMGNTGHWITVVVGNLFIIVVEGAIVTIQALRLEYYEGFSRFFSGDGRKFEPLRYKF